MSYRTGTSNALKGISNEWPSATTVIAMATSTFLSPLDEQFSNLTVIGTLAAAGTKDDAELKSTLLVQPGLLL